MSRHIGEHAFYMAAKKAKLSEQFLEDRRLLKESPPQIFLGVHLYVNGYTVPPAEELKNLIIKYGGVYSTFLDSSVTHMVANTLPDTKVKLLKKIKVIRPEWILDSVKHGKLLNCSEYFTYNPLKNQKQVIWSASVEGSVSSNLSGQVSCSLTNDVLRESVLNNACVRTTEGASTDQNDPVVGADVHSYHNRSRLHFLSTMKMELKTYISDLKKDKNWSFLGLENLRNLVKEKYGDSSSTSWHGQSSDVTGEPSMKVIIHIDMDAFFVSVSRYGRPDLEGVPIVVTSSKISNYGAHCIEKKDSMADIACCSYEARAAGVRNGMRIGKALQFCPKLVAVPYEFEKYRTVSKKMYETAASYTLDLEAVSCDELYIDCNSVLMETKCSPLDFADLLRKEIKDKTGCSASVGIGANRVQARLATRVAKPNGVFYLLPEKVETFMKNVPLQDLPGVGPILNGRLKELNLHTCGQLLTWDVPKLEKEFGPATGKTLYRHCQGLESLPKGDHLSLERKSVSSEINYGIRFTRLAEAEETLINLSKIVSSKLGLLEGKCITLKLKVRSPDAAEVSAKFLGHGVCDNLCRTSTLDIPTSDPDVISKVAIDLLKKGKILVNDIRGLGIMVTKLEQGGSKQKKESIKQFFKQPKYTEKHSYQVNTKKVEMALKCDKEAVRAKKSGCGPLELGSSFSGNLVEERVLIDLIDNHFKSFIMTEKLPNKQFKNTILCILLNEVAQLNIASAINSLRELSRLSERSIPNPDLWKIWKTAFEEIEGKMYETVSKVIGYPIKHFSCLCK